MQLRLFSKIINEIAVSKIDSISHKNHENHKSNQTILEWFQFDFIQMSVKINFFTRIILSQFFCNVWILLIRTKVVYMSSSFWLLAPESRDLFEAEKEFFSCSAEQIQQMTIRPSDQLRDNVLLFDLLAKLSWANSQNDNFFQKVD